jgi:hypothetical protein
MKAAVKVERKKPKPKEKKRKEKKKRSDVKATSRVSTFIRQIKVQDQGSDAQSSDYAQLFETQRSLR